ncbi:MAG TPA: class I SAM-dependent methyltransferase [Rhodanobacteraceae bacterium]
MSAADLSADEDALRALWVPFENGDIALPRDGRVLFVGARASVGLQRFATRKWCCEQTFKPFADALQRAGFAVREAADDERFACVLLLLPRQRDERRALFAHALAHVDDGGVVVASVANREGARSAQDDMALLTGATQSLSKHKCRVFWAHPQAITVDADLLSAWQAHAVLRETASGLASRPGLFAWDRIDAASALLAECLPDDLHGRVADLGAGAGFLSVALLRRCPGVTALDLFEADARALPAARRNLEAACTSLGRDVAVQCHWHDVAAGVPGTFDAVISNPPFHQGHAELPELGRAFIVAAANALRSGGTLWMVANQRLPYEATLRAHFAGVRTVVERDGYKVIEATR